MAYEKTLARVKAEAQVKANTENREYLVYDDGFDYQPAIWSPEGKFTNVICRLPPTHPK